MYFATTFDYKPTRYSCYQARRLPRLIVPFLLCCLVWTARCPAEEGPVEAPKPSASSTRQDEDDDQGPFGMEQRTPWTTSGVVGSPDPPHPYLLKRRFANLTFNQPIDLLPEPGSNRLFVLELEGNLLAIDDDDSSKEKSELLDLTKEGFTSRAYSLIVHPRYEENGSIFACVGRRKKGEGKHPEQLQVLRYSPAEGNAGTFNKDSETLIIEWLSNGHAGGDIAFGPDGMLYIGTGDGTAGSDINNTGQDITNLDACILRIDVDHPAPGKQYGIPPDNPFLHIEEARPEIWAFGLRQAWRLNFDPPTGHLWVGEVGQDLWEMIHLVKRGGNYGWSVREGNHPFYTERKVGPAPISPPIVEHHHSEARSITGGFVYRAVRRPELVGTYIYCDYETGKVWGFRYAADKVENHRLLTDSTFKVASFGQDHAGEVYLLALSGEIFDLEPNEAAHQPQSDFPRTISRTGLFSDVAQQIPATGVIPYAVNAEVWTDGAYLERYIGIPGAGKIGFAGNRGWRFPDGAVLAQTISLETETGNSDSRKRIETRLFTRQEGQWAAYTYRWNDEQTDAALVDANGHDEVVTMKDAAATGGTRQQTWHFPSRSECMGCHSRAANWVLGLSTVQMNRAFDYAGVVDNQLRAFDHIDLFEKPLEKKPTEYKRLVDPDDDAADLSSRARSYLHANCSHCHVSDGGGNAKIELEFHTAQEKTNIFGVVPLQGDFDILDARLVAAGDPYRSVILHRVSKLGRGRMPRLGSTVVDERGIQLLHEWIHELPSESSTQTTVAPEAISLRTGDQAALKLLRAAKEPTSAPIAQSIERLLSTTSGALLLLHAINDGRLTGHVATTAVEKATSHPDVQVRDLFEKFLPEEQRVKRLGNVFDPQTILAMEGDAERGELFFFKTAGVQCQNCHRINGKGRELGPDLSKVGKKLDRVKLLESIINPSKLIDEKFVTYLVETTGGRVHTGLLIEKNDEGVLLKDNQNKPIRIPADKVELIVKQRKSLMPELLLRDVTAQQAADLLAYLSSLK